MVWSWLTKAALANIKTLVPGSDGRYVLAGFGWHQGWNDRINDKFNAETYYLVGEAMGRAMLQLCASAE